MSNIQKLTELSKNKYGLTITGMPSSGKTYLIEEMMVNLLNMEPLDNDTRLLAYIPEDVGLEPLETFQRVFESLAAKINEKYDDFSDHEGDAQVYCIDKFSKAGWALIIIPYAYLIPGTERLPLTVEDIREFFDKIQGDGDGYTIDDVPLYMFIDSMDFFSADIKTMLRHEEKLQRLSKLFPKMMSLTTGTNMDSRGYIVVKENPNASTTELADILSRTAYNLQRSQGTRSCVLTHTGKQCEFIAVSPVMTLESCDPFIIELPKTN